MSRADLLALDDDKLAALANRGLVKRSRKDLAAGAPYELELSPEGTLTVQRDGVTTRLPAGVPLSETDCSCGARSACRHRVFAVLAYQAQAEQGPSEEVPWEPGSFTDVELEKLVGPKTLKRARTIATKGVQIQLRRESPPVALLPTCTVTFLVANSLAYARCDCAQPSACEHIPLAVWAFREGTESTVDRVELMGGKALDFQDSLAEAEAVIEELLLDGAVSCSEDMGTRLEQIGRSTLKAGLVWMSDLTYDLAASLKAYRERSALYSSQQHLRLLTEWLARRRAGCAEGAELTPACVLGIGEPPETALEHIRLTSLGARIWMDAEYEHAEVYLVDPDTSTVMVVSKKWARGVQSIRNRSVFKGVKLETLAKGQLVTKAAKRRANRSLSIGRNRVAQSAVFAQKGEWRELFRAPLFNSDFAVLRERLARQGPALLRARVRAEQVVVLAPSSVHDLHYNPGEQQVLATLLDWEGEGVQLVSEFTPLAPTALEVLYKELEAGPQFVSGHLSFQGGALVLTPLAVVCDRVVVPALSTLEDVPEMEVSGQAYHHSRQGPVAQALERTRELLARCAHGGLRFLPASWEQEVRAVVSKLDNLGLGELSAVLQNLAAGRTGGQARELWTDLAVRLWLTEEAHLKAH